MDLSTSLRQIWHKNSCAFFDEDTCVNLPETISRLPKNFSKALICPIDMPGSSHIRHFDPQFIASKSRPLFYALPFSVAVESVRLNCHSANLYSRIIYVALQVRLVNRCSNESKDEHIAREKMGNERKKKNQDTDLRDRLDISQVRADSSSCTFAKASVEGKSSGRTVCSDRNILRSMTIFFTESDGNVLVSHSAELCDLVHSSFLRSSQYRHNGKLSSCGSISAWALVPSSKMGDAFQNHDRGHTNRTQRDGLKDKLSDFRISVWGILSWEFLDEDTKSMTSHECCSTMEFQGTTVEANDAAKIRIAKERDLMRQNVRNGGCRPDTIEERCLLGIISLRLDSGTLLLSREAADTAKPIVSSLQPPRLSPMQCTLPFLLSLKLPILNCQTVASRNHDLQCIPQVSRPSTFRAYSPISSNTRQKHSCVVPKVVETQVVRWVQIMHNSAPELLDVYQAAMRQVVASSPTSQKTMQFVSNCQNREMSFQTNAKKKLTLTSRKKIADMEDNSSSDIIRLRAEEATNLNIQGGEAVTRRGKNSLGGKAYEYDTNPFASNICRIDCHHLHVLNSCSDGVRAPALPSSLPGNSNFKAKLPSSDVGSIQSKPVSPFRPHHATGEHGPICELWRVDAFNSVQMQVVLSVISRYLPDSACAHFLTEQIYEYMRDSDNVRRNNNNFLSTRSRKDAFICQYGETSLGTLLTRFQTEICSLEECIERYLDTEERHKYLLEELKYFRAATDKAALWVSLVFWRVLLLGHMNLQASSQ